MPFEDRRLMGLKVDIANMTVRLAYNPSLASWITAAASLFVWFATSLPHGGVGGVTLFFNFVYAHSGADCILMIVASKFSVYAEHHYCICNEYFVCFVDCSNIDTVNTAVLFRSTAVLFSNQHQFKQNSTSGLFSTKQHLLFQNLHWLVKEFLG